MANPEHLRILQQGVEAWNQWRRENRGLYPDLSRADLSGADLSRADLSRADLSRADLRRVHLVATNFAEANLTGCRVYGISAWNVKLERTIQLDPAPSTMRGYPETLSLHRRKLMQHPCGNEIQGDRKEQVGSA